MLLKNIDSSKWILLGCALMSSAGGFFYWRHTTSRYMTTKNAYVNANTIYISSQVAGVIEQIHVSNNQLVQQGDPLFTINPELFNVAVDETYAQVSRDQAQVRTATANFARATRLVAKKFLPVTAKDHASANLNVALANLKLSTSKLKIAKLNLEHTQVIAPATGIITGLTVRPGSIIQQQTPLFMLIDTTKYWIDANFKETQILPIKPQQSVKIILDMAPNKTFTGKVDSISGISDTAFAESKQNTSGAKTKTTQYIPVKILLDENTNILPKIGSTATVTVDTKVTKSATRKNQKMISYYNTIKLF